MGEQHPAWWQRKTEAARAQWRERAETDHVAGGAMILGAGVVVISLLVWWADVSTDEVPTSLEGKTAGSASALYAIGAPVLIAALAAVSLVLLAQGVTAIAGGRGRGFTREVVAWLVGALLATLAAAVLAKRWDDPGMGQTLHSLQQTMRIIALVGGYIIGGWIVWAFRPSSSGGRRY